MIEVIGVAAAAMEGEEEVVAAATEGEEEVVVMGEEEVEAMEVEEVVVVVITVVEEGMAEVGATEVVMVAVVMEVEITTAAEVVVAKTRTVEAAEDITPPATGPPEECNNGFFPALSTFTLLPRFIGTYPPVRLLSTDSHFSAPSNIPSF